MDKGANSQESNPGASKGSSFQKEKGKGRGGKKGKLFLLCLMNKRYMVVSGLR